MPEDQNIPILQPSQHRKILPIQPRKRAPDTRPDPEIQIPRDPIPNQGGIFSRWNPNSPIPSIERRTIPGQFPPTPESDPNPTIEKSKTPSQSIQPQIPPPVVIPQRFRSHPMSQASSADPIDTITTNQPDFTSDRRRSISPVRRSSRRHVPRQLMEGMVRYTAKGPVEEDHEERTKGSSCFAASTEDNSIGPGISSTATEIIRSAMVKIPQTHREAMKSQFADQWLEAEETQLKKFEASNTMTLVTEPPKGTKILPGKWVYDIKQDTEGYVLEFRARWVVCGNRQSPGVDFQPDERYAPVVSDASAKLFITMAAIRNWKREQWDVIGAYLNAAIDNRIIFMKQPTGHEQFGPKGEDLACVLNQALYGLRQAGHLWHELFKDDLSSLGLLPIPSEPCIFTNKDHTIFVMIYVDDILATGHEDQLNSMKKGLSNKRKLKTLPFKRFLGCDVIEEPSGCIFMSQQAYLTNLIHDEGYENCNPSPIPMNPSWKIPHSNDLTEDNAFDQGAYTKIIGKIG